MSSVLFFSIAHCGWTPSGPPKSGGILTWKGLKVFLHFGGIGTPGANKNPCGVQVLSRTREKSYLKPGLEESNNLRGDTIKPSRSTSKKNQVVGLSYKKKGTKWKREPFWRIPHLKSDLLRSSLFFWVCRLTKNDATPDLHQDFGWTDKVPLTSCITSWMIRVCGVKTSQRKRIWIEFPPAKFFQTFCKWPTPPKKNTRNTNIPETPRCGGFATDFLLMSYCHLKKKFSSKKKFAKGTARWKRARCVVSWPWTCTTSPGLKETAKLLCAAPGVSDGLEDGDGGWWMHR